MRKIIVVLAGLFFVIGCKLNLPDIDIYNPYSYTGKWYKGQIHMHTTNSDGKNSVEEVLKYYIELGYDFIAITDHNYVTLFTNSGIFIIGSEYGKGSEENTANTGHILALNVSNSVETTLKLQERINNIVSQDGVAILAHPNWRVGYTYEQLMQLTNYTGIEIFNGLSGDAVELWDSVLSSGKIIWGFANDDEHSITKDAGKTAIYVLIDSLSTKAILDALKRGSFYSVRGHNILEDFSVQNNSITVCSLCDAEIKFIGYGGEILTQVKGRTATYYIAGDERYIRVELISTDGVVWLQPLIISESRE